MATKRKRNSQPQRPRCQDCGVFLGDSNYGGSSGAGKMLDARRGKGLCVACCELREIAR